MDASHDLADLRQDVHSRPLPTHVAIIMDGNGRWAERAGQPRALGHREGSRSVREVTRAARALGLRYLTLYAFSTQNWLRPTIEVAALMALLAEYLLGERDEILGNGIRLETIGQTGRLPEHVREPLEDLIRASRHNRGMQLTLALSYGGREEIVQAAQLLAQEAIDGTLSPLEIDEDTLRRRLWTGAMPDPDLIIRTSGEQRLSNFLLFQLAYSELVVTETHWPEFRERHLLRAVKEYQRRERRFGSTSARVCPLHPAV